MQNADIDWLKSEIEDLRSRLMPKVGDYCVTEGDYLPSERYGGTWIKVEGVFLVGQSDSDGDFDLGDTGGEKEVTLTEAQMPVHSHNIGAANALSASTGAARSAHAINNVSGDAGGDESHNNLPPFRAVYFWKRTA